MTDTPQTAAGRALLKREALNSRSFALITADAIRAIEREAVTRARSGLDAGLRERLRTWLEHGAECGYASDVTFEGECECGLYEALASSGEAASCVSDGNGRCVTHGVEATIAHVRAARELADDDR
jgi:hypothetical protein